MQPLTSSLLQTPGASTPRCHSCPMPCSTFTFSWLPPLLQTSGWQRQGGGEGEKVDTCLWIQTAARGCPGTLGCTGTFCFPSSSLLRSFDDCLDVKFHVGKPSCSRALPGHSSWQSLAVLWMELQPCPVTWLVGHATRDRAYQVLQVTVRPGDLTGASTDAEALGGDSGGPVCLPFRATKLSPSLVLSGRVPVLDIPQVCCRQ